MNGGNTQNYELARKLRSRFNGRGAAVSGIRASSTSELMKRAQMGGNPNVNCSELAYRDNVNARRTAAQNRTSPKSAEADIYRNRIKNTPEADPPRKASERKQTSVRDENMNASHGNRNEIKRKPASVKKVSSRSQKKAVEQNKPQEIKEKKSESRRLNPSYALLILVGTFMLMTFLFNISEIYNTSAEITRLENQLVELNAQEKKLLLELEMKNNLRNIEKIAEDEIGMVREDSVERQYISVSDGERIDVIDKGDSDSPRQTGVLLSSILSSFGDLFDYFR